MKREPWNESRYHDVFIRAGLTYHGTKNVPNSFSMIPHPKQDKAYRVKAIHTYHLKMMGTYDEGNPEEYGRMVKQHIGRLKAAVGRLEKKLYPDQKRAISVAVHEHPMSAYARENPGAIPNAMQHIWEITVQELEEFSKQRKARGDA